jgi:hypothetical protein
MAARRAKARPASPPPCFSVRVNGKHVAKMGMPGEGGVNVSIRSWSRGLISDLMTDPKSDVLEMFLGGTDRNNPKWDRFYDWPAPRLRPGDEIQIRVEDGVPDKPKFRFKNHRFGEDQMPSPENPTYVVVRNVSVWADKGGVLLRANDKGNVPRLTANSARKVAEALIRAADAFERSRRKARR